MGKKSKYIAKHPDENGQIHYSEHEHAIWAELIERQMNIIQGRACQDFLDGLDILKLPRDRIPDTRDISRILHQRTGWVVEPVPALIGFQQFFSMLAERRFPAASFIRSVEEMEYLQEPDIFHELFGHATMLTHPAFADFTHAYGIAGLKASKEDRVLLARLYWFTVEFGLVNTQAGLRSYGGGINSSPGELIYALESDMPERHDFDALSIFRTPYRIDIFQTVYYVIQKMDDLFALAREDLAGVLQQAKQLGEFAATFPPKEKSA
jgi:phenylalanine-4-hydroxylase